MYGDYMFEIECIVIICIVIRCMDGIMYSDYMNEIMYSDSAHSENERDNTYE